MREEVATGDEPDDRLPGTPAAETVHWDAYFVAGDNGVEPGRARRLLDLIIRSPPN